jgi:hypothetical protein
VGRIPAAALFVVVRRRRRRTREEYSVSTNHPVPKHWFQAVLGAVLKFLKLTSRSGISHKSKNLCLWVFNISTNQRTFGCRFFIYIYISIYIHKSKNL